MNISSNGPSPEQKSGTSNATVIRLLTYLMFMMFAMTTDSAGVIIPEVIKEFHLTMAEAGAFHYSTMSGIALAGLALGFLADWIGRKATILLGLSLFALNSFLFLVGTRFDVFLLILFISGLAVGIFKTGALALIGDISTSTENHTKTMNLVEGFFGVGAIIGPAIVTQLLITGTSWKWLFAFAGALCIALILIASFVRYPQRSLKEDQRLSLTGTLTVLRDPFALAFSLGAMLYVGVETAIYVWMPTLLSGYSGSAILLATYSLSLFFILRAAGRFLGSFLLSKLSWTWVLALCSGGIFACFMVAAVFGIDAAVYALPLSGIFMSVIYPSLNSKGISCFKKSQHGAVGGVILFFTCVSAVISPLLMGLVSDHFGGAKYGFIFATALAGVLFLALVFNLFADPSKTRLSLLNASEY